MERKFANPTFFDIAPPDLGGPRTQAFFDKCGLLIPWKDLAASLKGLYGDCEEGGWPPWPVVLMITCLMLQKWFGRSGCRIRSWRRF